MKLKWSALLLLLYSIILQDLQAESSVSLSLKAYVPHTIKTSVLESPFGKNQVLWQIRSQMNKGRRLEGQKIEIEGLDQAGVEIHLSKVVETDRTIKHDVLIDRLNFSMKNTKSIFVKISAN